MNKFLLSFLLIGISNVNMNAQWASVWSSNYIYGNCFAQSAETCFVAGNSGFILRTIDGGTNWDSSQTIFTQSWFDDIDFPSPLIGYACGGTAFGMHKSIVAKTIDGGQSWDSLTSNTFGFEFYKEFCVNDSVAFFCGDQMVKTTDGGNTFSIVNLPFFGSVSAVYFFSDSSGVVATNEYVSSTKWFYRISSTSDAGDHWTTVYLDSIDNPVRPGYKRINDIDFSDPSNGIAVAENAMCIITNDEGMNWSAVQLFNDSTKFTDVDMIENSGVGYMTGWKYNASLGYLGRVFKTLDFGANWVLNYSESIDGFYSISAASVDTVYATAYAKVFKTINGGINSVQSIQSASRAFSIIPNPASDLTFIRLSDPVKGKIEIRDIVGRIIFSENRLPGEATVVDVSKWKSGTYIVVVADGQNLLTTKFIVHH